MVDHLEAIHHLHMAWDCLCPEEDRNCVIELVKEMKEDGLTDPDAQIRHILGHLYGGMAYGNWPSVVKQRQADAAKRLGIQD